MISASHPWAPAADKSTKAAAWTPKVGDKVDFEVTVRDGFACRRPRWNFIHDALEQPSRRSAGIDTGVVENVFADGSEPTMIVRPDGGWATWVWPMPGHPAYAPGRVHPVGSVVSVVDDHAEPVGPTIVHTEIVCTKRGQGMIPISATEAAFDRGERAVRRAMREWPYGKNLLSRRREDGAGQVVMEWAFFPDDYDGIEWA